MIGEVLLVKVVLPSYVAVIGCVPTARFVPVLLVAPVIVNVATPAVDRVAVPFVTVPSLNVTEPAGIAVPDEGRTVAVKIIAGRAPLHWCSPTCLKFS